MEGPSRADFEVSNVHYEMADKARAINCGGIGAIHLMARNLGLVHTIVRDLHLLKVHLPYHESYRVLNSNCPSVIQRKLSFGTQSDKGRSFLGRTLSVSETGRLQQHSAYDYLVKALSDPFSKNSPPSLLPAL